MTHLESMAIAMDAIFYGKSLRKAEKKHVFQCSACEMKLESDEVTTHTEPNDGMDNRNMVDDIEFLVSDCCGAEVEEI